ncbi:two-component sensor histidine kinase [Pseudoclavibacter sp. RFBJ3]|uniref:sensor histidine kinase n=1 Tax=unclassified Pseudoclavibacter TaxID=2615177 RepID=UPI000CE8CDBB|nr:MULTISPECIES: histidine kinase [unclassified Pseudoclavibacter]PPF81526.1 two-component sensor histidine kinase [Pseudoclavibacter sp. RFBJ5]PPF90856.1 two-component sensor histidine kinase [Pseudoclavibacter sp. RFBJ3]PPG00132.1 two-component sensor histidine kinase [Pseudoclavibacter sp. RFBH5]PPG19990.1 two-component sensor histidine kinase [Pseudoclavibacter sp. RFBI4]
MSARSSPPGVDAAEVDRVLSTRLLLWFGAHPRTVDAVVALLCLGAQMLVLVLPGAQNPSAGLLLVPLSCGLLLWRRRFPRTILAAVASVSTAGLLLPTPVALLGLPAAVALYTLASLTPITTALLGYAVAVGLPAAGMLLMFLTTGVPRAPSLLDPLALIALALGIAVRSAARRREALAELVNQRLSTARVVERQRISAEMHDIVAHSLSTMIALADGASKGWETHPERSALALGRLGDVGRSALADMNRVLRVLRGEDAVLDESLQRSGHNVPELEEVVEVFRGTGVPVTLARSGETMPDSPTLATTVYRIVQESLTNVLRYATGATRVEVSIDVAGGTVTVQVTDDGCAGPHSGRARSQGTGRGLLGVAERAATYGGTSAAGPRPGGGWMTRATLQIDEATRT